MSEYHVICTHPNAGVMINGVAFGRLKDREGSMTIEPVSKAVAEDFAEVPHFTIHPVGGEGGADGEGGEGGPSAEEDGETGPSAEALAAIAAGAKRGRPSNAELAAREAARAAASN